MAKTRNKGKSIIGFPNEYVIIDIETTGLSPEYDSIIEMSAIKIKDGCMIDEFSSLSKPDSYFIPFDDLNCENYLIDEHGSHYYYVDNFISDLTGITNEMLANADPIENVLENYLLFLGDSVLVGHNVNFDVNFIYDKTYSLFGNEFSNDFIDTMRMARKLFPDEKHHRLIDCATMCNVNYNDNDLHRSLKDCELTGDVFNNLKTKALANFECIDDFVNSFKKYQRNKMFNPLSLKPETAIIDETHILYEKVCVFTGALDKMPRKNAMQIVVNHGGCCGNSITKETNFLILGNNDYCKSIKDGKSNKQKKAESLKLQSYDIEIMPESVFYDIIGIIE